MSFIALALNLVLIGLIGAALVMGMRLNTRLKALRDSHAGFAQAVAELDAAARRAEQGLADLRAATDEASDLLGDRIDKARALVQRLDKVVHAPPRIVEAPAAEVDRGRGRERAEEAELELVDRHEARAQRLGALISAAHELRPPRPAPEPPRRAPVGLRPRPMLDDDLFDDEPAMPVRGRR